MDYRNRPAPDAPRDISVSVREFLVLATVVIGGAAGAVGFLVMVGVLS